MNKKALYIGATIAALVFVGWVATTRAKAADLSGNCCADLEERVAELEATVARKGNRRVSVKISGVVHKGILWHSNTDLPGSDRMSIYDGTTDPTRLRIDGEGRMSKDWAAGFVIEVAFAGNSARGVDTGKALLSIGPADGKNEFQIGETGTVIRHSFVYLTTPLGKLSLGQQSMATDGIIEINLANTHVAARPLQIMPLNFSGSLSGLYLPYDGYRATAAKWESPTLAGFTASAAWTDTESFDVALRYAGEFSGFRFAAGIGYRDQQAQTLLNLINVLDILTLDVAGSHTAVSGSASLMHMKSGVFVTGFYSQVKYENLTANLAILPPLISVAFPLGLEKTTGYGFQAGVEKNFFGIGATTLFGEWQKSNGQTWLNDVTLYGAGVVQAIDALAMDVYLSGRRIETEGNGLCVGLCRNTDVVTAGARIKF